MEKHQDELGDTLAGPGSTALTGPNAQAPAAGQTPPIPIAHMPGPWYFRHIEWGDEVSDDWTVCEDRGDGTGRHVAHVAHINQGDRQPQVELANARLIAAAPDLLESLMDIVQEWGYPNTTKWHRAKAAIDKATKP